MKVVECILDTCLMDGCIGREISTSRETLKENAVEPVCEGCVLGRCEQATHDDSF